MTYNWLNKTVQQAGETNGIKQANSMNMQCSIYAKQEMCIPSDPLSFHGKVESIKLNINFILFLPRKLDTGNTFHAD